MGLTISDEEHDLLLNILEHHHRELLNEIAHTDRREFKQGLRKNEQVLDSLVSRIRGAATPGMRG